MRILLALILALTAIVADAAPRLFAPSCGPAGCPVDAPEFIGAQRSAYIWKISDKDTAYLWLNGKQIGGWDATRQQYRALVNWARNEWGDFEDSAPFPPPANMVRAVEKNKATELWQQDGVSADKLQSRTRHSISGQIVSYEDGLCQKAKAAIEDDSGRLFLSVWARDHAKRAAVVEDLKRDPELWKWVQERCHLWAGAAASPDHFLTKDREGQSLFAIDGEPTITLQLQNGVELWHDAGYTQGQPSLQEMRKRDPNYRPDQTPGPNSKKKDSEPDEHLPLIVGGIALAGLLFWPRRKEPT